MARIDEILDRMRSNPQGVRFRDLYKVCETFFGAPRVSASSHAVFRTPWQGDPRINIQNATGMAKTYQVRQVLQAIERMENEYGKRN